MNAPLRRGKAALAGAANPGTKVGEPVHTHSTTSASSVPGSVDNLTFASAFFGPLGKDILDRPYFDSFTGKPAAGSWGHGGGFPSKLNSNLRSLGRNNYMSIATFHPLVATDAETGAKRNFWKRTKAQFAALHAVLLDDLGDGKGAKVPVDQGLRLKPTSLVETSPGNFQALLKLREPIGCPEAAERLLRGLMAQGVGDASAKDLSRLCRLPVGCNGKYQGDDGFPVETRLAEFNPEVSYTPEEIAEAYGFVLEDVQGVKGSWKGENMDAEADPYYRALEELGMVRGKANGPWVPVECFKAEEHSNQADETGAYYRIGGGYECNHSHELAFPDLKAWLHDEHKMDTEAMDKEQGFKRDAADEFEVLETPKATKGKKASGKKTATTIAHDILQAEFPDDTLRETPDGVLWRFNEKFWERYADKTLASVVQSHLEHMVQHKLVAATNEVVTIIRRLQHLPGGHFGNITQPIPILNCENGEVWLTENGPELRPHSKESYQLSCNGIVWDPDAKCPNFDKFLRSLFCLQEGDEPPDLDETVRHVEELLGYAIQPLRFLKSFGILKGDGDNGKTELIRVLVRITGSAAILFTPVESLGADDHQVAALLGMRMVIDDDAARDKVLPDSMVKKASEATPLSGAFKFKDKFNFLFIGFLFVLANHWPQCRDLSAGMRSRACVLEFKRRFLKPGDVPADHPDVQRKDLVAAVYEELPGVLACLVRGFYRVRARGSLLPSPSALKAAETWLGEINSAERFLRECLHVGDGKGRVKLADLYQKYLTWAFDEGIDARYVVKKPSFNSVVRSGWNVVAPKNIEIVCAHFVP